MTANRAVVVGTLVALLAPQSGEARRKWLSGDVAFSMVNAALASCSKLDLSYLPDDPEDWDETCAHNCSLEARRVGKKLQMKFDTWGNGRIGRLIRGEFFWLVQPSKCTAVGLEYDGNVAGAVWELKGHGRAVPTGGEVKTLLTLAGKVAARPDEPRFGAGRLMATPKRCKSGKTSSGWALQGPISPVQPVFKGRPRGGPNALWSPAKLKAIGIKGNAAKAIIVTDGVRRPKRVRTQRPYQIYSSCGGGCVAVFDTRATTHRWVLDRSECVEGKIRWIGGRGELYFGFTTQHYTEDEPPGHSLFVLSLGTGAAFKLTVGSEDDPDPIGARLSGKTLVVKLSKKKTTKIPVAEILARIATQK